MIQRVKPLLPLVVVAASLFPAPLVAGSTTGHMAVSLIVPQTCALDASPLSFDTSTSAQSRLRLRCTPGAAYSVMLDEGHHGGRRMVDPSSAQTVNYQIYRDSMARQRWGNSIADAMGGIIPGNGEIILTAYGKTIGEAAEPGHYSDVVTVTVAF